MNPNELTIGRIKTESLGFNTLSSIANSQGLKHHVRNNSTTVTNFQSNKILSSLKSPNAAAATLIPYVPAKASDWQEFLKSDTNKNEKSLLL